MPQGKGVAMIRVALIDGHELIRIGLKTVLKQSPDIEVIADTGDPKTALSLIEHERLDLAFVDADIPLTLLCDTRPTLKVVLMSTVFDPDCLLQALCGTVAGYLLKDTSPRELTAAVHAIACGGIYIHSTLTAYFPKQLIRQNIPSQPPSPRISPLSTREQSVLDLLVKGHTNREVSERLFLSPKTVESYRAKIYSKLGVKTRSGLFSRAIAQGLVAL
jgi:two-component system response regulator NreC